jgi:hypothetical protein
MLYIVSGSITGVVFPSESLALGRRHMAIDPTWTDQKAGGGAPELRLVKLEVLGSCSDSG